MVVVMDVLYQPTKPLITSSSPSPSISDRNFNYYAHVSTRYHPLPSTSSSSFGLHRITSQLAPNSSKTDGGYGCSWMQDNSTYKSIIANHERRHGPLHSMFPSSPAQVSSVEDLFEFICSGPLIEKLGFTPETIAESIDKWLTNGFHISDHRSTFKDGDDIPPLVIGFSAPQGCGKTTLVFALDYLFSKTAGRKCATISIDDFYLTYDEQAKLREKNPSNALLEFRGNAGSHDLPLSIETLTAVSNLTKEGMKMKLPRYDKSAYNGRGDRADPSTWPEVEGPLSVVLFEGWMLGFKPLPAQVVKAVDPQLEIVNKNLEAYYDAWDKFIKSWIIIKIKDPSCVYQWRLQAEIGMREAGNPGMTDEEVMDFVSRYLPAYNAYLPTLYTEGPKGSDSNHTLIVEIDEERNPILAG
ncbi:unnamed protein product [Lactuca saligna]|uniref:Phosphoribulokinase/uridine kinase domain-containing protein n=1 Tax=Lactuca saligna TaxID=75948 RepID=A0AA35VQP7_LACSI|nr:unnamed protein product [Lactuca saligna]